MLAASRSRFHARDLSVEALSALFDRMAQRYSTIIIDLPLSVHSWTLPLLAASKGILVTGLNTIPGLRQIEETLRALARGGHDHCGRASGGQPMRCRLPGQGGARRSCGADSRRGKALLRQERRRRGRVRERRIADCARLSVGQVGQGYRRDRGVLREAELGVRAGRSDKAHGISQQQERQSRASRRSRRRVRKRHRRARTTSMPI